jgi:hypothetical protein
MKPKEVSKMKLEIKLADIDEVREIIEQDKKDIEDLMVILAYALRNDCIEDHHEEQFMKIAESRGYKINEDCYVEYKGEIL